MSAPEMVEPQVEIDPQIQAMFQSLQNQRNAAFNALASTEASVAVLSARLKELQAENDALKAAVTDLTVEAPPT